MGVITRYALATLVLVGLAIAPAPAAADTELAGVYMATGVNANGATYRRLVYIARHGESFLVSWMAADRNDRTVRVAATSVGVGISSNGMLAVSYLSPQTSGIVMYRIEDGGRRLAGQWTTAGEDGALHAEILMKVQTPDADPDGGDSDDVVPGLADPVRDPANPVISL
jgi:hypothetical protein